MTETGATFLDRRTPPTLFTLIATISLSVLAMNMFLPSLPALAAEFEADYGFVQLAVSGYLGVTALMQLVIGPLSDRYGRRPIIIGGFLIFIAASVGCALAPNVEIFMLFRMIQAAVATGMVLTRAIVRDMLPEAEAASMIGYVTAAMALTPMISPMLGGFLEAGFGWRATFWVFVAAGVLVLALVLVDLGETNRHKSGSFAQQFGAYPELFASRRFWGYAMTAAFASGSFFALLGGGPFVAREIFGQTPEMTGLYLGSIALGYLTGNLITGRIAARTGVNRMMLMGCTIATTGVGVGFFLNLFGVEEIWSVFGPAITVGLGNGLTMPSSTTGMLSVRPNLAGSASGLGSALLIGGGAGLSQITGALLSVESGPLPLMAVMFASAVCSLLTTLYVMRRARRVGAE